MGAWWDGVDEDGAGSLQWLELNADLFLFSQNGKQGEVKSVASASDAVIAANASGSA